jgi:hypothetical protein
MMSGMSSRPPINVRAYELSNSGDYETFDALEVVLIAEYGLTALNQYRANTAIRRDLGETCRAAAARKAGR